jgi:glutamate-ammonia-ligase adenylyltransferase
MGYRSDLDLVFVYDSGIVSGEAAARLAKKLITGLTSLSGTSKLYEIDVRLRPDGASGFLVTSFDAMQDYQIHRAKTWEHQALTRARACAGDLVVGMKFEQLRLAILILPRNTEHLALEITSMRKRMHKEHDLKIKGWDIKLSEGGLVDIEFMVQFLVLAYSKDFNGLLNNIGNIALLRYAGSTHLVPPDLCESVAQAYLNLRALQHRLELQGESRDSLPRESAEPSPSNVLRLWQTVFTI